jgi:hypothetical protein
MNEWEWLVATFTKFILGTPLIKYPISGRDGAGLQPGNTPVAGADSGETMAICDSFAPPPQIGNLQQ